MLQQFFAVLAIFIILIIVFGIIKIVLPIYRFLESADVVIKLYEKIIPKEMFEKKIRKGAVCKIQYGKYKLEFSDTKDACVEFEKLINKALEYYDKLGWIAITDNTFKEQKDKLINISYEVRKMRWLKE